MSDRRRGDRAAITAVAPIAAITIAGLLVLAAVPAGGATVGVGDTDVTPTAVSTGSTTSLDLSVNATGVDTADGTTDANVTVSLPAALDVGGATVTAEGATPNATGVTGSVDPSTNAVVVSWDDDGGVAAETVAVTVTVTGVAADRTGEYDLAVTVDGDGDGATDASGTVGTVTASATASDRSVTDEGGVLYLGEEDVDLTGIDGVATAGSVDQFYGVGGEADGDVAEVDDAAAVDVSLGNGFAPGKYALTPAGDTVFVVQQPNVTDIELFPGEAASETDVSGSSIPPSVGTLTVDPTFDFDAADDATVIVEDADGLNVTDELATDPTVATDGETVALDVSELSVGTYTVRVEGATDLDHVTDSTTVRVRSEARTVSVSRTRVARGESTVATVSGPPGELRYVRFPAEALGADVTVSDPTAEAIFASGEGLVLTGADVEAGVVYAEVSLESDGFARVEIDTGRLEAGTNDVVVARDVTADDEATVPVTVTDRSVSVTPARTNVTVGETVTVSGTARGATDVKLYARVGGEYVPLRDDDGDLAETGVDADGSWDVDLDTRSVVNIPDRYRLAAVADPGDDYLGSSESVSESTLREFDAVGRAPLDTFRPSLSASVSQSRIATAAADEVTVAGRATGPRERVRAYVVSPRGAVDAIDVAVDDDDGYDFDYAAFDTPGRYRLLLVAAGRDSAFAFADTGGAAAIRDELSGSETTAEAVATIRDAYGGAGVDDRLRTLNVTATDPRVSVEAVRHRGDELVVAGTSNREDGTVVLLDLRRETGAAAVAVAAADAEVNASGRWRTALDVSAVDPGEYALRAETDDAFDVRAVRLETAPSSTAASATATPTETPRPSTPATTVTPTSPDPTAAAGGETPRATDRATRTGATGDGFGAVTPLLAFALAVASAFAFALLDAIGRRRP